MNHNQNTTNDSQNQQEFGPGNHRCGTFRKSADRFEGKSPWGKAFGGRFGNRKAVNIEENETSFTLSLYAAGLNKSNFKISVNDDILTIAHSIPKPAEAVRSQYIYQEYEPASFERSFRLNGKVLTQNISASYTDGVMIVTLPKDPETNKPAQEVNVS